MGYDTPYTRYLQEKQDEYDREHATNCHFCGCDKSNTTQYIARQDKWTRFRLVVHEKSTAYRRYICPRCLHSFSPSLALAYDKKDGKFLRENHVPMLDRLGRYRPYVTLFMLQWYPPYYPIRYLGELNVRATFVSSTKVRGGLVLQLLPDPGQEYYMDIFIQRYSGICIFVSSSTSYPLQSGSRWLFHHYYDRSDRFRVNVSLI